jgi:hypothetical protein
MLQSRFCSSLEEECQNTATRNGRNFEKEFLICLIDFRLYIKIVEYKYQIGNYHTFDLTPKGLFQLCIFKRNYYLI